MGWEARQVEFGTRVASGTEMGGGGDQQKWRTDKPTENRHHGNERPAFLNRWPLGVQLGQRRSPEESQ